MVTPEIASVIIVSFLIVFGLIMPILEQTRVGKVISQRWCVVVVILALLIGAVLDFKHLDNSVRLTLVTGALVISGGYVLLRSFEKMLAKGWLRNGKITVKHNNTSAEWQGQEDDNHSVDEAKTP